MNSNYNSIYKNGTSVKSNLEGINALIDSGTTYINVDDSTFNNIFNQAVKNGF